MVQGPGAGLEMLEPLDHDPRMANHHRLDAVRAHLFEMAGERDAAIDRYRTAARRTASLPERSYLLKQAARLSAGD
jgi:predicted RNA polymerase sigma factor